MYLLIGSQASKWHIEPYFNDVQRAVILEIWLLAGITIFGDMLHIGEELWQIMTPAGRQLLQGSVTLTVAV